MLYHERKGPLETTFPSEVGIEEREDDPIDDCFILLCIVLLDPLQYEVMLLSDSHVMHLFVQKVAKVGD